MQNSGFFTWFCIVIGVSSLLFLCELSKTDHFSTPVNSEFLSSKTKSAMFEPRHHGHKLFEPHHHGHKMPATTGHSSEEQKYDKVLPKRHNHPSPEKDQKEPMAKDHQHHNRSNSNSSSSKESRSSSSNDYVYLPPLWDTHGASQQPYRNLSKHTMVEGGEGRHGRHQKKKYEEEDYYYTVDAEYEIRTMTASSKVTHFLKQAFGWMLETENDEPHESFLRGGGTY